MAIAPLYARGEPVGHARPAPARSRGFVAASYEAQGFLRAIRAQLPSGADVRITDGNRVVAGSRTPMEERPRRGRGRTDLDDRHRRPAGRLVRAAAWRDGGRAPAHDAARDPLRPGGARARARSSGVAGSSRHGAGPPLSKRRRVRSRARPPPRRSSASPPNKRSNRSARRARPCGSSRRTGTRSSTPARRESPRGRITLPWPSTATCRSAGRYESGRRSSRA